MRLVILFPIALIACYSISCRSNETKDQSTLIISHQECSDCLDAHVDSGEVKISSLIRAQFKGIERKGGRIKREPNLTDLNLNDDLLFKQLWGGYLKVNIEKDTLNYDFFNRYRVKGYVMGFDSTGHTVFKVTEYAVLDSLTNKKFE
jgi:hypothetical protein